MNTNTDNNTTAPDLGAYKFAETALDINAYKFADAYLKTCGLNREQRRKALKEHGLQKHR